MNLRLVLTNYMILILQCVVFSSTAYSVMTYGTEFDWRLFFAYIACGFTIGTTISSIIIACKFRY